MFKENLRVALRAIAANKLRSVLTMLGIIIGVSAVISLVALGNGVDQFINGQFAKQGSNLVFIIPVRVEQGKGANRAGFAAGPNSRQGQSLSLTLNDVEALKNKSRVPDLAYVAPLAQGGARAFNGDTKYLGSLRATSPDYRHFNNWGTTYGDWFDEAAYNSKQRVALIGSYAYTKLFPEGGDPVGLEIRLNDIAFRVIGVLKERSGGTQGSEDDSIIIPLTTFRERMQPLKNAKGQTVAGFVLAQAADQDKVDAMVQQVTDVLRQEHGIQFAGEDDFSVGSQRDLQNTVGAVTGALTIFLAAIAGISLFVGGIGIMNIMLVSVTERTREIGLRKAIGARRSIILMQFVAESIFLSLLGGTIGIALGWGMAQLVVIFSNGSFQALVTPGSVALAFGFSAFVGLVFGVYPAWRASQLNPIEALRYE